MYGKFIKHPIALTALSQALLEMFPSLGGKRSVEAASKLLGWLHEHDLQVGPAAAFGEGSPREVEIKRPRPHPRPMRGKRDPFDGFLKELAKTEERRPWEMR